MAITIHIQEVVVILLLLCERSFGSQRRGCFSVTWIGIPSNRSTRVFIIIALTWPLLEIQCSKGAFLVSFPVIRIPRRAAGSEGKASLSVGNHVTVIQLVRGSTSARLRSALGRWNPVEQTGLCIYSCFRTYRLELFNRVLSNQPTEGYQEKSGCDTDM
jgi:hypothetical protein